MDDFEHKNQTFYESARQGNAHVITLPHINSFPFPTITWYENIVPMNDESVRHQVTLNKTLVLLDRGIQDSRHTYQPEALNGNTGDEQTGPTVNLSVLGNTMFNT